MASFITRVNAKTKESVTRPITPEEVAKREAELLEYETVEKPLVDQERQRITNRKAALERLIDEELSRTR